MTLWFQRTAKCSVALEVLQSVTIYIQRYQLNSDQYIIFVWGEYITYLSWVSIWAKQFTKNYWFLRNSNFGGYTTMPIGCDDFVFRKVNWPLPLSRGGWVGFRLTAKLPLSMTKPNCRCSLTIIFVLSHRSY